MRGDEKTRKRRSEVDWMVKSRHDGRDGRCREENREKGKGNWGTRGDN